MQPGMGQLAAKPFVHGTDRLITKAVFADLMLDVERAGRS